MKFTILAAGKVKEQFTADWIAEFEKRLSKYCSITTREFKESTPSEEAKQFLAAIKPGSYIVALDSHGKQFTSEQFAAIIKKESMQHNIEFIIGGPDGLSTEVKAKANLLLSFGQMTYTHQLARVLLLEQLYRAMTIIHGGKYHK
ncbi:23S rRNA (pseudouridine(1915)-N(3))-methyltransferase RlmH [Candidatus Woesearchaeota archaeon]|nr:23S rRNA (pseudouridine(1915)-N(3))-methyltransferase RlmH [Candidatus Woesearchaeota archaeon]